jgi:hypothetical protein
VSKVPEGEMVVTAWYRGAAHPLVCNLELLQLYPDADIATITWRATLRCGHRLLDVTAITIAWKQHS